MIRYKTSKLIIMLLTLMMFMSMSVFAVTDINITSDNKSEFESVFKRVEESVESSSAGSDLKVSVKMKEKSSGGSATEVLIQYDSTSGTLTFNEDVFKRANPKEAKKVMTALINEIKDSSLPLDMQQDIMSQIQESDNDVATVMIPLIFDESKADLFTAYKWLFPFLQILRVVFGIGAVAIVLLLIGSTIMDLVYIGLPVWREQQADKGKKNPFGVSYEAIKTVNEVEKNLGDGGYQNAYLLYLKRRALTYVVLAICLLYLIVGELGGLISWILNLASGVVG